MPWGSPDDRNAASNSVNGGVEANFIRQRLGSLLVQSIVPLRMPLPIVTFDSALEQLLVHAVRTGPEAIWPFEPQLANRLLAALSASTQPFAAEARAFAVVTAPACRAAVSRLVWTQFSDVPVLSFLEIPATRAVDVIAVVGSDDHEPALTALLSPTDQAGDR